MTEHETSASPRSRGVAFTLAVIGGVFGLHRFYTGKRESGIWMCVTVGGLGIWYLYDVIIVAAGEFRDAEGRRVTRWEIAEDPTGAPAEWRVDALEERIRSLEAEAGELAERLDFAERLLAKQREKDRLAHG